MAALAVAFKRAGFSVSGSDSEKIFPPMSTHLKKSGIKYNLGFAEKNIQKPDEVVVGNAHVNSLNPEIIAAKKKGISLIHFPRLVEKYLIQKNSVVVAGTYGKTTTTAMVAWILEKCGWKSNFMLGGIPLNFGNGARLIKSNWSVVEGDEYPAAAPWDKAPKFKYYHPRFLILTSAEWDHMDVYKTKESYLTEFKKLVASVPRDGIIVAKLGGENLNNVLKEAKCKVVYYSNQKSEIRNQVDPLRSDKKSDRLPLIKGEMSGAPLLYKEVVGGGKSTTVYFVDAVKVRENKTEFEIKKYYMRLSASRPPLGLPLLKGEIMKVGGFETKLLGEFNLENWCAAVALVSELKMPLPKIQAGVKSFSGVKRRLEIRGVKKGVTVIDDFAHNPSKARQSVLALRRHFPQSKIFVIFEPNRGGRSEKCLTGYDHVFVGVNKIFIPELTNYPPKNGVVDVSGKELAEYLKKTHAGVAYESSVAKLVAWLKKNAQKGDVIAFLGSRNFGGAIERIIS